VTPHPPRPTPVLGPGGEFDRIRAIWQRLGPHAAEVGDDAAIVHVGGEQLALSCDMAVEGRHFRLEWLRPTELGWRIGASAISDLAAVAAEPIGMLVSVGVPERLAVEFLPELMAGVGQSAAHAGAVVWGGDLVQSDAVVVDVMVAGRAARPVRRSGARAGDALWVTGRLGGPHEAVAAWLAGREPGPEMRARYARPLPRVREALWLRDHGATALIDVSDGLTGDAGHLAAASGVALAVAAERVPRLTGVERWESALVGGEEYELLVTLPPAFGETEARAFAGAFDLPLTRIGGAAAGQGVHVTRDGQPVDLPNAFSHF
jgi:thiamine-monophosphate kinase